MTFELVWTPERKAALREFWSRGYSGTRCAGLLAEPEWRPTADGVRSQIKRMRLAGTNRAADPNVHDRQVPRPRTFWTDERVAKLKEIAGNGLSASEMAAQLGGGITRNGIIGKIHRLGLRPTVALAKESQHLSMAPARVAAARNRPRVAPPRTRVTDHGRQAYEAAPDRPIEPLRTVYTATEPRHWTTRKTFECTWIVVEDGADSLACCAPIARGSWCYAHAEIGYVPPKTTGKEYARSLRRFTGKAA